MSAVEIFISEKVTRLVIISGDGTIQTVLTRFLQIKNANALPEILILPGGTTNMTASDLGIRGSLRKNLRWLHKVINRNTPIHTVKKSLVKVSRQDAPPIYGFFFGTGMIANGVQYFNQHVKKSGLTGEFVSITAIIPFLFKLFMRPKETGRHPVRMECDGNQEYEEELILFFATTLDRLLYGIKPGWGNGDSPLRIACFKSDARHLWRTLFKIILKPGSCPAESEGYFSKNMDAITLTFDDFYIIDGELFQSRDHNFELKLTASDPVTFIIP